MISVIIPVYNTASFLERCIDSILSQSYNDLEVLLIDDGSTDDSGAICDRYADRDGRVRVIHKENGGVSSARNKGLDNAKGEWICFVDSDDELMSTGLELFGKGISSAVDMVMAGYKTYDDDNNCQLVYSNETCVSYIISSQQAISELFAPTHYKYQGYVFTKLFRASVIKDHSLRFNEEVFFNEDRLFVAQFICTAKRDVFYTTSPTYKYYLHQGSVMSSLREKFNPKFITDFDAQTTIRGLIRATYSDKRILDLADWGLYNSYRMIVKLSKKSEERIKEQVRQVRRRLIKTIGLNRIICLIIQRNKRKIMRFLTRQGLFKCR